MGCPGDVIGVSRYGRRPRSKIAERVGTDNNRVGGTPLLVANYTDALTLPTFELAYLGRCLS